MPSKAELEQEVHRLRQENDRLNKLIAQMSQQQTAINSLIKEENRKLKKSLVRLRGGMITHTHRRMLDEEINKLSKDDG